MGFRDRRILDCIRAGEPLTHLPVIDFHTHLGASSRYYTVPYSSPAEVLAYMDRYGVDHLLAFALSTTTDPGVKNRSVYQAHREHPGKFSVLTTLHARFPQDWIALLEEGEHCGSRGIKLLSDYQGVDEMTIDWSPAFDFARDKNWVVLHHDWRTTDRLAFWAQNFPQVTFVVGHPTLDMSENKILKNFDNVYQSTCAAFVTPGFSLLSIEQMVDSLPLEKILHGSDALDLDFGTALGSLA